METMTPRELAHKAGMLALSRKGFDVKILKLEAISSVCDYFVVISGDVNVHVKAIADAVVDGLLDEDDIKPYHIEGLKGGNWVLIDYVDVVVHVFMESTRNFYALEKLWGDAPSEKLSDE